MLMNFIPNLLVNLKWVPDFSYSDALNMSRDVHQALTDIIAHYLSDTEPG